MNRDQILRQRHAAFPVELKPDPNRPDHYLAPDSLPILFEWIDRQGFHVIEREIMCGGTRGPRGVYGFQDAMTLDTVYRMARKQSCDLCSATLETADGLRLTVLLDANDCTVRADTVDTAALLAAIATREAPL